MSPIKDFKMKYEPLNKENTFAAGDTITGVVEFTVTEETTVKCLYVKAKGDANVHWSEKSGDHSSSYRDHRRFYKVEEVLVPESEDGTVLAKGDHHYEFKLKIPEGNIPRSFRGFHGEIVHVLLAKTSRNWHNLPLDRRELNFVSRTFFPTVQSPQAGATYKKVGTFSKGQVDLSATVDKTVCSPGETLQVTAKITNKSSKKMRIKFSLDQKSEYRARHRAKIGRGTVSKIVGQTIEPGFDGEFFFPFIIPADTQPSIYNCEIITVEFYLRVYLDIKFAIDPKVEFPLVIIAPGAMMVQHGQHGFPSSAGAVGGPSSSDFPPPFSGPYPSAGPPNAYPYPLPGPVPYQSVLGRGDYNPVPGYSGQTPQQPVPYGQPGAPFMPFPVQPQTNTTNSQFPQDQAPPAYTSLYPPVQSGTDMDKKPQL